MYQNSISLLIASSITAGGVLGGNWILTSLGFLSGCALIYANVARAKKDLAQRDLFKAQADELND